MQTYVNDVFEKVNTGYDGSMIFSLGESEESTDLVDGYHIGYFNNVPFLPVSAYGVAINPFGVDSVPASIYCGVCQLWNRLKTLCMY